MSELIQFLSDPNVAYLFITFGLLAILGEILHPGTIFLGLLGTVALILGGVGLGQLPFNWGGLLLLALAAGMFTFELLSTTSGLLAFVAIVAFACGSLLLYNSPAGQTPLTVNPWLIVGMALLQAAFFVFVVREVRKSRRAPLTMGIEALYNQPAQVVTRLNPRGKVRVGGEVWTADLEGSTETADVGQPVEVTGVDGVILKVRSKAIVLTESDNWSKPGWEQEQPQAN